MAVAPRLAADVLAEVSYHLVENIADATVVSIAAGGFGDGQFGGPPTYGGSYGFDLVLSNVVGFYPGALVVVGWRLSTAEVATVRSVNQATKTVNLSDLTNVHTVGETIFAPTFPTQAPSDPLWTQTEALEYLARAQNDFLIKVSCLFERFLDQPVLLGQQFQQTPATAIEMERVAIQNGMVTVAISSISRASGVVTATTIAPTTFSAGLPIWVDGVLDSSFDSASTQTSDQFVLTDGTTPGGTTLTWLQEGPDTTSSGGTANQLLYPRLYQTTQEQVALADPDWFYNQASAVPTRWYEDRTGKYQWGLAPVPRGSYFAELLASVRGPATLGLLDALAVPTTLVPYVKYGALASFLTKAGEARSPSYAAYCQMRFDVGVLTVQRYLQGFVDAPLST